MKHRVLRPMEEKLVRDKIPDRIRGDGLVPITRTAKDDERLSFAVKKLVEEAVELNDKRDPNEYGDMLEAVRLVRIEFEKKFGKKALAAERRRKKKENGGFRKFIILMDIRERSSL